MVGTNIHAPDPDKVALIQQLEIPKSKKDVRSLSGPLSYYRPFVNTFYKIARTLIELIKKRAITKLPGPSSAKGFP